jgi:hypothetical protein
VTADGSLDAVHDGCLPHLIVFSPLVGALIVQLLPEQPVRVPRVAAFVVALVPFVLALLMLAQFDPSVGTLQLRERVAWIPQLGVDYAMGVDGFSLWLILLTTFLTPVVVLAAWTDIADRVRLFMVFMLVLESAMLGALCATALLLFFFFWEFMLIPMAFVIWLWGHARRRYAAIKFILYTLAGSAFMLVGVVYLALRDARRRGRRASTSSRCTARRSYRAGGSSPPSPSPSRSRCRWCRSPLASRCARSADGQLGGSPRRPPQDGHAFPASPSHCSRSPPGCLPLVMVLAVIGVVYGADSYPQPT